MAKSEDWHLKCLRNKRKIDTSFLLVTIIIALILSILSEVSLQLLQEKGVSLWLLFWICIFLLWLSYLLWKRLQGIPELIEYTQKIVKKNRNHEWEGLFAELERKFEEGIEKKLAITVHNHRFPKQYAKVLRLRNGYDTYGFVLMDVLTRDTCQISLNIDPAPEYTRKTVVESLNHTLNYLSNANQIKSCSSIKFSKFFFYPFFRIRMFGHVGKIIKKADLFDSQID